MVAEDDLSARVDRNSALPLWAQVHADLLARIQAGEFTEGFPGEHSLTTSYGVSRHTIREALRHLRHAGVLIAERGRATRLADIPVIEQPLGALYSLFAAVEATGVSQHSVVRVLDIRRDPTVAQTLELPSDAPLVYLERLRMAGEHPLALDFAWLPSEIAEPLLEADFTHTALYIELEARCGVRLTGGREDITAVVPEPSEAELLALDERCAALAIRRLSCVDERPVELRHTLIRADRFTVSARFSPTEGYRFLTSDALSLSG
ncbi:GntR family transcriptional regulator [Mycolicibacterium cosmeticum]|uniref:GntR family transcriptional regulator n=1 Tax=Mycolicibacterium cosmeticum TaxID=258533 RepID=W9BLY4_MYCCO|nr:GntR family transcriptional regulator [Mycolicibacterium cosmeticum]TLH81437.1 GntR family transcriptional regulator [Mycolicibacterium cosmeticum]CDO10455.1 GntR family transcriptional regulator [Mycolicibacterium cosmeticum]